MKKTSFLHISAWIVWALLFSSPSLKGQTVIDHPIQLVNTIVEANEFMILHSSGSSSSFTKTTIGSFDPSGQKVLERNTTFNPSSYQTGGKKFLQAIAVDYNGDNYDEPVLVVELANGTKELLLPTVSKGNLDTNFPNSGFPTVLPTPANGVVKMASGDFDGNGQDELVLLTRSNATNQLILQLRGFIPDGFGGYTTILIKQASVQSYVPLNGEDFEAFDVAIGDYDNNGQLDIAVVAFEQGANNTRQCYTQMFEVRVPNPPNNPVYQVLKRGKTMITPTGSSNGWENVAIKTLDRLSGEDILAVALAYQNPNNSAEIYRELHTVITDLVPGVFDIDAPVAFAAPDRRIDGNGEKVAISIEAGYLLGDIDYYTIVAWNGSLDLYFANAGNITHLTNGSVGNVQDQFYQLVAGNQYLSVGDADYDQIPDILVVTTDDDGSSGNPTHSLKVSVLRLNLIVTPNTTNWGLETKGEKEFQKVPYGGQSDSYHFAAVFGEFKEGRVFLKEPTRSRRATFTPLIVNNAPPHHFDIVNGNEADIFDAYPAATNWPGSAVTTTFSSEYQAVSSTSQTMETTLNSDWGLSATISGGISKLGNELKTSITARYGEEFSATQTNTETVTISTKKTAKSDDQIYGIIQEYDVFEYPVDSSGVTIGYVLALMRDGPPIDSWFESKSTSLLDYMPDHEPGNLFSYAKLSNFDDYVGLDELIVEGTGDQIGAGGGGTFTMSWSSFNNNSVSTTKKFGVDVNVSGSGSFKIFQAGFDVNGTYNREEIKTHSSEVYTEVGFTNNLNANLASAFESGSQNARYTVKPSAYWARNGALTLGFAVDLPDETVGIPTFWSTNYGNKPDLTMILPWRMEEAKNPAFIDDLDLKRLSKSVFVDKTSFVTGDTIEITALIHNYSFTDYIGEVAFQLYAGNPNLGGTLLADINGNTSPKVSDAFLARERTTVRFQCKVPAGIDPAPRIYVVIDPNNLIDEVHEDNNTGFRPLGLGALTSIEEALAPEAVLESQLFPNPANDQVKIKFSLPNHGEVNLTLWDMQGRHIRGIYQRQLARGTYQIPVDIQALAPGTYFVQVAFQDKVQVLKLIKH